MSDRLKAIASLIRTRVLADVGSDHGSLLISLLKSKRIEYAIAIENKQNPFENSVRALAGLQGEARFGDGLKPLAIGEATCLSICGIGAKNMLRILDANPERIPPQVVLQPSNHADSVRQWAQQNNFQMVAEVLGEGSWPYTVLSLQKSTIGGRPPVIKTKMKS